MKSILKVVDPTNSDKDSYIESQLRDVESLFPLLEKMARILDDKIHDHNNGKLSSQYHRSESVKSFCKDEWGRDLWAEFKRDLDMDNTKWKVGYTTTSANKLKRMKRQFAALQEYNKRNGNASQRNGNASQRNDTATPRNDTATATETVDPDCTNCTRIPYFKTLIDYCKACKLIVARNT